MSKEALRTLTHAIARDRLGPALAARIAKTIDTVIDGLEYGK